MRCSRPFLFRAGFLVASPRRVSCIHEDVELETRARYTFFLPLRAHHDDRSRPYLLLFPVAQNEAQALGLSENMASLHVSPDNMASLHVSPDSGLYGYANAGSPPEQQDVYIPNEEPEMITYRGMSHYTNEMYVGLAGCLSRLLSRPFFSLVARLLSRGGPPLSYSANRRHVPLVFFFIVFSSLSAHCFRLLDVKRKPASIPLEAKSTHALSHSHIRSPIGKGKFASVWKAQHYVTHEVLAIKKIVLKNMGDDTAAIADCRSEAHLLQVIPEFSAPQLFSPMLFYTSFPCRRVAFRVDLARLVAAVGVH